MRQNVYDMEFMGEFPCEVVKYNVERGFGFLKATSGPVKDDAFVHYSEIDPDKNHFKKLFTGQKVTSKIYRGGRGYIAIDVATLSEDREQQDGNY